MFTYKLLLVAVDALRELGADVDEPSWSTALRSHEQAIGKCAAAMYRKKPNAAVFIGTFEGYR